MHMSSYAHTHGTSVLDLRGGRALPACSGEELSDGPADHGWMVNLWGNPMSKRNPCVGFLTYDQ